MIAVLRSQHQDRRPHLPFAQRTADAVAVHPWQHHVEHDHVGGRLGRHPQTVDAVARRLDREPRRLEPLPQGADDLVVVVDDEHLHPTSLPLPPEPTLTARQPRVRKASGG